MCDLERDKPVCNRNRKFRSETHNTTSHMQLERYVSESRMINDTVRTRICDEASLPTKELLSPNRTKMMMMIWIEGVAALLFVIGRNYYGVTQLWLQFCNFWHRRVIWWGEKCPIYRFFTASKKASEAIHACRNEEKVFGAITILIGKFGVA